LLKQGFKIEDPSDFVGPPAPTGEDMFNRFARESGYNPDPTLEERQAQARAEYDR
jgi:hypothetical protein